jgi:hypothetical protein
MKQILGKAAIATAAFACAGLFSFGWSDQGVVSMSIESAQARVGRPLTPMSAAGVARRHYRRGAYGYGAGVVGTGVGVAAVGTAAAVAATRPWGWGGPYVGSGYYGGPLGARAAYYGGYNRYGYNSYGSYNAGAYCVPGEYYMDGGLVQLCK